MRTKASMRYRRHTGVIVAVAALLIAAAGIYSGLAARSGPWVIKAVVTGYQTTGFSMTDYWGKTTGPVSVVLSGAPAAGLYRQTQELKVFNDVDACTINWQRYHIVFTTGAGELTVWGMACGNEVDTQATYRGTTNRDDAGNALLDTVQRLLPATATATKSNGW